MIIDLFLHTTLSPDKTMTSTTDIELDHLFLAIPPEHTETVRVTLQFLVFAERPVTALEVTDLVGISKYGAAFNPNLRTQAGDLLEICRSFIVGDEKGFIKLKHATLKEYLIRQGLDEDKANLEICQVCLQYLALEEFAKGPCETEEAFTARVATYPFVRYAARYWYCYAQRGEVEEQVLHLTTRIFSKPVTPCYLSWVQTFRHVRPGFESKKGLETCVIYFPVLWGLTNLVKELLKLHAPVNNPGEGVQPLVAAVVEEFVSCKGEIIPMLLEAGADPNVGEGERFMPLLMAARHAQEAIFDLLLRAGARVTPGMLDSARFGGSEMIIRSLLQAGADPNERQCGFTPLLLAINEGSENIVRMMIHYGADTAPRDGEPSPLETATAARSDGTVRSPGLLRMIRDPKTHADGCVDCASEASLKAQTPQTTVEDLSSPLVAAAETQPDNSMYPEILRIIRDPRFTPLDVLVMLLRRR